MIPKKEGNTDKSNLQLAAWQQEQKLYTGTHKVKLNYRLHKSWGDHYITAQDETRLHNDDSELARKA